MTKNKKEIKYTRKHRNKIIFGLSSGLVMSGAGIATGVVEVIKEQKDVKEDQMSISTEIKNALDSKCDKAVIIALIGQLENLLANPTDKATITIVRSILGSLKAQLQTTK